MSKIEAWECNGIIMVREGNPLAVLAEGQKVDDCWRKLAVASPAPAPIEREAVDVIATVGGSEVERFLSWHPEKSAFRFEVGTEVMTVAQHSRIVAAKDWEISTITAWWRAANVRALELEEKVSKKDAEIARLKGDMRMLEESHRALFDELRARDFAQPARQVGDAAQALLPALRQYQHNDCSGFVAGYELEATQHIVAGLLSANGRQVTDDERERFEAAMGESVYFSPEGFEHDSGVWVYSDYTTDVAWMAWSRRAALATAAVVMPERRTDANYPTQLWREAAGWNAALDKVARLNRCAIPVELLERIANAEGAADWNGCDWAAIDELRAMLAAAPKGDSHE